MKTMRHYQKAAHAAVFDAIVSGYKRILYTASTGSGKTVTFSRIVWTLINDYKYNVLVLANRRELIGQSYREIRDECGLDDFQIDVEQGSNRFNNRAQVVIGSVQTCYRETRLRDWKPKAIIVDEAHFAAADTFTKIFQRFPEAIIIGCTATAMRGDNKQLYAVSVLRPKEPDTYIEDEEHGYRMLLTDPATKQRRPAEFSECVFENLVAEYELLDAIEDGYLVQIDKIIVHSELDLSGVKVRRNKDGDVDYAEKELSAALEKDDEAICTRINLAIGAWREECSDRPTIVFAPSVRYAQWAAQLWHEAGYSAQSVDAETDYYTPDPDKPWIPAGPGSRQNALENVRSGKVQVTVNVGLFTHGTDVDVWSCAVMLKPTRSFPLYSQCCGRTTRPLSAIARQISEVLDAAERRRIISQSMKPNSVIIDVIDKNEKNNPCSAPALLGLPCDFDFEDEPMTEVKKLLDEYAEEEGIGRVLGSCPMSLTDLKFRLERLDLMKRARPRSMEDWAVTDAGYTYKRMPPGFHGQTVLEGDQWQTVLSYKGREVGRAPGPKTEDRAESLKAYQDAAQGHLLRMAAAHKSALPKPAGKSKGTLDWLRTWKDKGSGALYHLRRANFTDEQIDALSKKQLFAILDPLRDAYHKAKEGAAA